MKKNIFVIDAYNLIYRMFYAIPEMHTREGIQVNAIFGVAKFLKNLSEENPTAQIVVATDVGSSFREELFTEYKGTRDRMPDNLRIQIDGVFELFHTAKIPVIGVEWYEADDVMGSIATHHAHDQQQIIIISSDKDLCQFVKNDLVHIYDAMKRKFMREADVLEKFGVPTYQVRDYLAIVGDSADNIPGISGFWPKKTKDLLEKYGSLDEIYNHIDDFTPKMRETLEQWRDRAFLSQKLATIVTDLSISLGENTDLVHAIREKSYIETLKKYEFRSLIPQEEQEVVEKISIPTKEIVDYLEYESLLELWKNSESPVGVTMADDQKIYISYDGTVVILDYKKIDIIDFIDAVLSGAIIIAAYDAKQLFVKLSYIKNPLCEDIWQKSLF